MGALFLTGSSTLIFILSKTSVRVRSNPMLVCYTTCQGIQAMIVELALKLFRVTQLHRFYDAHVILLKSAVSKQVWPLKFN